MTAKFCKFRADIKHKEVQDIARYNVATPWDACWIHKLLTADQLLEFTQAVSFSQRHQSNQPHLQQGITSQNAPFGILAEDVKLHDYTYGLYSLIA